MNISHYVTCLNDITVDGSSLIEDNILVDDK